MAVSIHKSFSAKQVFFGFGIAATLATAAQAQSSPSAVPVPFTTSIAGTGGVGTTTCTGGILTTSGTSFGDGCAPTTAGLAAPQGVAVDKYGNVYVADYTDRLVRVIYNGGASVAAAIAAANSGYVISSTRSAPAPTPVVGEIYTIAGFGGTGVAALTVTSTDGSGKFACANYATSGQPDGLNSLGDGCPAASAPIGPRDVTVDVNGNLFLTDYTNSRIRVLCVNCASTTLAAQLIELEEPGVTPVNGAMYTIAGYAAGYRDGYLGFGNATIASSSVALLRSPTGAAISSSDDVYIADNLNNAVRLLYNGGTAAKSILTAEGITPTLGYVYTIAGAGCVSAATNKTGSVVTANSCLTTRGSDTATLGNALGVDVAWTVYLDPNNNLYFTDAGNARIKVIYGGAAAPLAFPNSTYSTLQVGYAYSFAGQGTLTQSGVKPSQLALSSAQGVGGDTNGNIFFIDYTTGLFYETYAQTGLTAVIGGGNAITTPAAAAYCNAGTTGPAMTDAFYDGCPLTQTTIASPRGPIVADSSGNLYFGDSVGSLLRKLTYNSTFPATTVGSSSASQPYAFTFMSPQVLATSTFTVSGATSSSFVDAGGDTCVAALSAAAGGPGTTCVVNVEFAPQQPGVRAGALEINSSGGVLGASLFIGTGTGAGLTVDPAPSTTTGTTLTPEGIAVDGAGRVLVADGASKSLLRYTSGTAVTLASGFSAPTGVAVDGAGNLFIADSSANTVTEIPITGTKFTLTSSVSSPHGLTADGFGNLYIADTGNNRVLVFGPEAILPAVAGFTGLSGPQGVAVDSNGNLYVADSAHVVKLTSAGVQTTIATGSSTGVAVDAAGDVLITSGTALVEYPASGSSAVTLSSALVSPQALALDPSGNAYIADSGLAGYLELKRTAGSYTFATNPASTAITLTSIGSATLTTPAETQTDSTDFSLVPATTNGCSGALASGLDCTLIASFNPTLPGTLTDNVAFNSNATNASPITLTLSGTTAAQNTSTTLKVSLSTLVYGNVETLTATVAGTTSAPSGGTVSFYNNTNVLLGSANVGNGGVATFSFLPSVIAYSVTAVFTPSGLGYFTGTSAPQTFSVTPATLTVTASNASRFYNVANPSLTYTISGFVNGDTQSTAVSGVPIESTTATLTSSTGSYPITITQGTLASSNYTFTFVNGTLTVTGATAQTITFAALPNVTYGVSPITLTATASSGQPVGYTVTGPATVSGSTLTISGAGAVSVTAVQNGNNTYAAAPSVTQSFTAAKASLSVTATNASSVYGAAIPSLAYTVAGFVNGDTQTTATTGVPTETTTALPTSNIGTYPITLTPGTLAATNYTFILNNGTFTINPATLTLLAYSASRTYGIANPTFSGTLTGAVNNDQLTETFSTTATISSPAGTYPIVPGVSGANAGNYTLAVTPGALTITMVKPAIVLAPSATSGYSGATSITLTATLTSPTSGSPTGTVTFLSGTTSLGSAAVSGGAASLITTALPLGADSVTAVYSGDTNFSANTSLVVLITISPSFSVAASSGTLAFASASYQEAQAILTINPGGRTDTLTFSCQGLPEKLSCSFSPSSLSLAGLTTPQTVQMLASNSSATSKSTQLPMPGAAGMQATACVVLPIGAVLLLGTRRRRISLLVVFTLIALGASAALTGCGTSPISLDQGAGTYNFTMNVNSGSTVLQTMSFTLTIP